MMKTVFILLLSSFVLSGALAKDLIDLPKAIAPVFEGQSLSDADAILVADDTGKPLYEWQANRPLIPASVIKLLTTSMAIDRWGLSHRFFTDFILVDRQLWVVGYGDPYLVSEELDVVASEIVDRLREYNQHIDSIHVDGSFFSLKLNLPGASKVRDPYNAPLSAVAANFNTAFVQNNAGEIVSAEAQTPLTPTAKRLAPSLALGKKERVNLVSRKNAEQHFGELLRKKLHQHGLSYSETSLSVVIDQEYRPGQAVSWRYRHYNQHTLRELIVGMLQYSNNFIANQLFLLASGVEPDARNTLDLSLAQQTAQNWIGQRFDWADYQIEEGAGLSRGNRLSASHIVDVLLALKDQQTLLHAYPLFEGAFAHAKTGTLNGIRTLAGYLTVNDKRYLFVFLFNKTKPYGYRERLLHQLAKAIK